MVFNQERDDNQARLEKALHHPAPPETILLLVRGGVERVNLAEGERLTIGRSDATTGFEPDIDLVRYHARKMGVSREHACISWGADGLQIIDLGSNNGTLLQGKPLSPHQPYVVKDGDSLRLGMLEIRVEFH